MSNLREDISLFPLACSQSLPRPGSGCSPADGLSCPPCWPVLGGRCPPRPRADGGPLVSVSAPAQAPGPPPVTRQLHHTPASSPHSCFFTWRQVGPSPGTTLPSQIVSTLPVWAPPASVPPNTGRGHALANAEAWSARPVPPSRPTSLLSCDLVTLETTQAADSPGDSSLSGHSALRMSLPRAGAPVPVKEADDEPQQRLVLVFEQIEY